MTARMGGAPRLNQGMLVRPVVVENEVDGLPARRLPIDQVQEGDELGVGVARLTALDHVALANVEGGKEGGRAVALRVMRRAGRHPRAQRPDRLRATQGLNLALR